MADRIQLGNVGVAFRGTIVDKAEGSDTVDEPIPLVGATALKMWFQKPAATEDGQPETVEFVGELYTDGSDGVIQYVTQPGDLDREGTWKCQAVAEFGAGRPLHSEIHKFKVVANLKADS